MCECDNLFREFKSEDLESAELGESKKKRGIYAIRIRERGKPIDDVISFMGSFCSKTKWVPFNEYVLNRTDRLRNIGRCPVIYIGATTESLTTPSKDYFR